MHTFQKCKQVTISPNKCDFKINIRVFPQLDASLSPLRLVLVSENYDHWNFSCFNSKSPWLLVYLTCYKAKSYCYLLLL